MHSIPDTLLSVCYVVLSVVFLSISPPPPDLSKCFNLSLLYHLPCIMQSALGWEHQSELSKHGSQTDAKKGFGGQFGVQKDRQDKVYSCMCRTTNKGH